MTFKIKHFNSIQMTFKIIEEVRVFEKESFTVWIDYTDCGDYKQSSSIGYPADVNTLKKAEARAEYVKTNIIFENNKLQIDRSILGAQSDAGYLEIKDYKIYIIKTVNIIK